MYPVIARVDAGCRTVFGSPCAAWRDRRARPSVFVRPLADVRRAPEAAVIRVRIVLSIRVRTLVDSTTTQGLTAHGGTDHEVCNHPGLRSKTASIRHDLAHAREIVLTANGRPFAVMTPVNAETVEEEIQAIRRARTRAAIDGRGPRRRPRALTR